MVKLTRLVLQESKLATVNRLGELGGESVRQNLKRKEVHIMPQEKGYVAALLQPLKNTQGDRRVWSIPLNGVWIPFFTATNVAGETAIPAEALGAPVRLQREQDGTPKFRKPATQMNR